MKVLFINPPHSRKGKIIRNISCSYESKGNYLFQPQDFLLLSSSFSQDNHELKLFDYIAAPKSEEALWSEILDEKADLILLLLADCLWEEDLNFLKKLRSKFSKVLWVAGDAFLEEQNRVEAQNVADAYVPHPFHLQIKTPLNQSLGILPLTEAPTYSEEKLIPQIAPRHELFLGPHYRWPFAHHKIYSSIFTSWGCPYRCEYCINANFPFKHRPLEDLKKELQHLKRLGVKEIYLGDRSFGFPKEEAIAFLKMMIVEDFKFSWSCYFHPLHTDENLLALMKESGCHTLIVGIEDLDQDVLKSYSRVVTQEKLETLFDISKKLNLALCGDFLLGLPHQTSSSIEKLINFSLTLPLSYASFNLLAPLPGTKLRKEQNQKGQDLRNFDSLGKNSVFTLGKIEANELIRLRNKALVRFYLRPSYLLRRLYSIKSLEHLAIQLEEMFMLFKKVFVK